LWNPDGLILSAAGTKTMIAMLIFGAVAGIGLGLVRFKVFALPPAIMIVATGTFGSGLVSGLEFYFAGMTALAASVSLQIGFLLTFLAAGFVVSRYLRIRSASNV
jgi:hypothetical protein